MAAHSTNESPWFFVFVLMAVVGVVVIGARIAAQRREAMAEMATRLGLQPWPDDAVPRGLSLTGTPFESWSTLRNVYEGILSGRQIVVFDFRRQQGKSGWSRTIIGIRSKEYLSIPAWLGLEQQRVREWLIIFSPVGFFRSSKLMDPSEIEQVISNIAPSANPH